MGSDSIVYASFARQLERELTEAREQRDRLAEELKEAQNAIEMMLRDSSCRRIPAYTEEQLAAMEGGPQRNHKI
jgi:predicted RecB family endonuclease